MSNRYFHLFGTAGTWFQQLDDKCPLEFFSTIITRGLCMIIHNRLQDFITQDLHSILNKVQMRHGNPSSIKGKSTIERDINPNNLSKAVPPALDNASMDSSIWHFMSTTKAKQFHKYTYLQGWHYHLTIKLSIKYWHAQTCINYYNSRC